MVGQTEVLLVCRITTLLEILSVAEEPIHHLVTGVPLYKVVCQFIELAYFLCCN